MSSTTNPDAGRANGARWIILVVGLVAMTAGCTFQYGIAYLIPALRHEGFSLELASVLVACPTAGLLLTLIGWGAAADRWGERVVLATGLGLAGLVLIGARSVHGTASLGACLALAGAAVPLLFLGAFCLAAAAGVVALVHDPPREDPGHDARQDPGQGPGQDPGQGRGQDEAGRTKTASPYRQPVLWRIHAASALLVVPQFTVATFALVFLVDARGWTALAAGRLLACAQACGAASRLGAGYWSDRAGSRMRPMRILAGCTAVGMLALAAAAAAGSAAAVPALLACGVVAGSTNGLAFTAVAEYAGSSWAGRALGIQNTGQNALAAATPPLLALAIGSAGYGASFAAVAAFPVLAIFLVPVSAERAGRAEPRAGRPGRWFMSGARGHSAPDRAR
jgi:MFS family permease